MTYMHWYKLWHINQTGQSTTWKEACINKFKKYVDCRFWANIYKIYWDFGSVRIFLYRKKTAVETISTTINDISDVLCFDLYLIIFAKSTKAEICTDVCNQANILLFICYCWRSSSVEDLVGWLAHLISRVGSYVVQGW